jgi:hypothetical protein
MTAAQADASRFDRHWPWVSLRPPLGVGAWDAHVRGRARDARQSQPVRVFPER